MTARDLEPSFISNATA